MKVTTLGLVLAVFVSINVTGDKPASKLAKESTNMELGAFSISLAVKDLATSRAFYEKLGFEDVGGDPSQNWQIFQNGTTTIGGDAWNHPGISSRSGGR